MVSVQIAVVHMNSGDLSVGIRSVVIDTFLTVTAAAIDGLFVVSVRKLAASVDLSDTVQKMEKL